MTIFTVIDILLGAFYMLFLLQEVIWEWQFFNANGPHYLLTSFYYLRVSSLPIGVIGFIAVQQQNVVISKAYFNLKKFELGLFPLLGLLSSYDM